MPSSPDTPSALRAAALRMLEREGWDAITVRGLAAEAGVNAGLVHYHYGSVRSVLLAAVGEAVTTLLAEPATLLAAAPTPARALVAWCDWLDRAGEQRAGGRLLLEITLRATRDTEVASLLSTGLSEARSTLERRYREQEMDQHRAAGAAAFVVAAADGLLLHALVGPDLDVGAVRDHLAVTGEVR